ncbi:MAG: DUF4348 domain-containing protein, partial [Kangiellaceae bacterium]|nr:DUF4348 domain-containing protein [Kangiellaceae bacterium]
VRFPARVHQEIISSKEQWNLLSFTKEKGFYSILQSDTSDYFEKNFLEDPITASIISFETFTIDNLSFQSTPESWYLDHTYKTYTYENDDYEFLSFINSFSSDSTYQKQNTRFPLPYFHLDYQNDYKTIKDTLSFDTWKHIDLDISLKDLLTLNQDQNSDYRVLFFRGIANGVHIKYTFKRQQKQWQLVKIEDYST